MEVIKLNNYTIIFKYQEINDQPNIVYLYGSNQAILVDAGPSKDFAKKVSNYLKENNLRLPTYVIITHYHWDHTFGMCGYDCKMITSSFTDSRLKAFKEIDFTKDNYISDDLINLFSKKHLLFEYPDLSKIEIKEADIIVDNKMSIDLGELEVLIIPISSSHTKGSLVVKCLDEVIIGDAACERIENEEFIADELLLKQFLKELTSYSFKFVIEGHSDPWTREAFIEDLNKEYKILDNTSINNIEKTIKEQYKNADKLNTRISIHAKYSTNKQGFNNWIYANYEIKRGMKVLELGCGTGETWKPYLSSLPEDIELILTDFSKGMLESAKNNLGIVDGISYNEVDIQNIPYPNNSFDIVIANMMLYHVSDILKALKEVKRVLKQNGIFYCATYGENGIVKYISNLLSPYGVKDNISRKFTLQNGYDLLTKVFDSVDKRIYTDSLAVTNIDDMITYIKSLAGLSNINEINNEIIKKVLQENMNDGVLNVPKEYGMFICK